MRAAEAPLPHVIAQDRCRLCATCVVRIDQETASGRAQAQCVEVVAGDRVREGNLGLAVNREIGSVKVGESDDVGLRCQFRADPVVCESRERRARHLGFGLLTGPGQRLEHALGARRPADEDEFFRGTHRQFAQQQRIGKAEHRRSRPDSQSERANRRRGEDRRTAQQSKSVPHILDERIYRSKAPHIPGLLTNGRDVAEHPACLEGRVSRVEAFSDQAPPPLVDVGLDFLAQVIVVSGPGEVRERATNGSGPHHPFRSTAAGSIRVARRAGMAAASMPAKTSAAAHEITVKGSNEPTPNRSVASERMAAYAAGTPASTPAPIVTRGSLSTSDITLRVEAPRARRTAISPRRWDTAYATAAYRPAHASTSASDERVFAIAEKKRSRARAARNKSSDVLMRGRRRES